MKKFQFTPAKEYITKFNGSVFYDLYKDSEFLKSSKNVETILSKGYELRKILKKSAPGETIVVGDMMVDEKIPLLVKCTSGPNIPVENHEFTYNRLLGFVAAYAFINRHHFPNLNTTEAEALGLTWSLKNPLLCKLYLSATSGAEHFEQFAYFPLLCALLKLHLKLISLAPVLKMAKIKNNANECMSDQLKQHWINAVKIWSLFPESKKTDFNAMIARLPFEVRKLLIYE